MIEKSNRQRLKVETLAALANWNPKSLQAAVNRAGAADPGRTGVSFRAAKIGGRHAPALADAVDAALARLLIYRNVTTEVAFRKVRPVTNEVFSLRPGKDIDAATLVSKAGDQFMEAWFKGVELVDVRRQESRNVLADLQRAPLGAYFRAPFEDGTVILLFSIGSVVAGIVERAREMGIDLANIEHGQLS